MSDRSASLPRTSPRVNAAAGKPAPSRATTSPQKKPFIVDAPASLLKRNAEMSRNERILYAAMRALANGKTGELKIPGGRGKDKGKSQDVWLKATAFDRAAEMCRDVRMRCMRKLIALGLVTMRRERIERVINGRRRVVMGRAEYTVHKSPHFLLKSISSTVEEIDSQYLSNPPVGGGSLFSEFENSSSLRGKKSSSAPATDRTADDSLSRPSRSNVEEIVNDKPNPSGEETLKPVDVYASRLVGFKSVAFGKIQARSTESAKTINAILDVLLDRAANAGTSIHSVRYLECGFDSFVADEVGLYAGWARANGIELESSPAAIVAGMYTKMRFVHSIVKEAALQGRPSCELLTERLASEQKHEATS